MKLLCKRPQAMGGCKWVAVVIAERAVDHHLDTYLLMALEIQRTFKGASMTNIECRTVDAAGPYRGRAYCMFYLPGAPPAETQGWETIQGYPF